MLTITGMTDSEKNDFINIIYGQLKEREAQNEALHAKFDAQMDRFDKLQDKYKKAYIWCLVNKAAKIVIFFYDNGSRGRKVLTDFIGDAEIAALQSDAYNVYNYLDSELS